MKESVAATDNITLAEFLALPKDGYRDEVSRGRLIREPQPSDRHGEITARIAYLLMAHLERCPLGGVRVSSGFLLKKEPLTIRGPDVAFVRNGRSRPAIGHPLFDGAPDLAVEIVSPSNTAADLQEKIAEYFDAGTRLVWVVYPQTHSIAVHDASGEVRMLSGHDTLTGADVLPEFDVVVDTVFR